MLRKLLVLPVLTLMILATGCAHSTRVVTETQIVYQLPPEELLSCKPRPTAPARGALKADWMDYIADLRAYGADCEGKVRDTAAWVARHKIVIHR